MTTAGSPWNHEPQYIPPSWKLVFLYFIMPRETATCFMQLCKEAVGLLMSLSLDGFQDSHFWSPSIECWPLSLVFHVALEGKMLTVTPGVGPGNCGTRRSRFGAGMGSSRAQLLKCHLEISRSGTTPSPALHVLPHTVLCPPTFAHTRGGHIVAARLHLPSPYKIMSSSTCNSSLCK